MIDKFLEVHMMTIAQYSFELGVLNIPSKIVGIVGGAPAPPPMLSNCVLYMAAFY